MNEHGKSPPPRRKALRMATEARLREIAAMLAAIGDEPWEEWYALSEYPGPPANRCFARAAPNLVRDLLDDDCRLRGWLAAIGNLTDVEADERSWMVRDALAGKPAPPTNAHTPQDAP